MTPKKMNQKLMNKSAENTVALSYGEPLALALLWQKAILLIPLWALPAIPFFGLATRYMGALAVELGYGLLMCLFVLYFLEDSLKRKIRIDDQNLFFGFRVVPIREIISLDSPNRRNKLLPANIAITTSNGRQLKLKLDGLSDSNLESLISHLQARNSAIKVSPVLNVLLKAHRVPQLPVVVPERLELAYQDRPVVGESIAVFRSTAGKWMRVGPIVISLLAAPIWMSLLTNLFFTLQPHSYGTGNALGLEQFFTQCSKALALWLYSIGQHTSTSVAVAARNPWATGGIAICFSVMFLQLLRMLWKPNQLVADSQGLSFILRLGFLTIPFRRVQWQEMQRLQLQESSQNAVKIHIERTVGKAVEFNLAAINVDERALLLKRIEERVPNCPIEHEAVQSLLPQSDRSYTELWLQSLTQAPERSTLDPLEPGQVVGESRYEVLHSLGVGGQGTAYLCRDLKTSDNKLVVLKETLLPVFVDPIVRRKALEGFEREAKLLQSLEHSGIVQLLDFFVEDHRAYLVLEHLSGSNMREHVLKDGPVTEAELQHYASQMCVILKFLHERGVVHRDFSPENLIVDASDRIKLIDFNVAQQTQGGSQGAIVGKPAYMPPEQFRGKATGQSDIYALGATLFFLLTGHDPEAITQSSVVALNSNVSPGLNQIIKRCTALQLNHRYLSADEIAADLDDLSGQLAEPLVESNASVEASTHG
ncbi:MAG: serine/threonine-protein kinase [Candidatus Obscuribacterales bacterium]